MPSWLLVDLLILTVYGLQHTLLTTKTAVGIFNRFLPAYTWNIIYSTISVVALLLGFHYWQTSGVYLFQFTPGSVAYHVSLALLAFSLFLFFYCFKFTTSFWQWLGVKQIVAKLSGKKMPDYFCVRKEGIKRYVRFPHHTCLILFFWTHPVMTLDTLVLAIGATIYLYLGTYHQDTRGLRLIGKEWQDYQANTDLLLPSFTTMRRMVSDWKQPEQADGLTAATK
jgi:methanethiol S-methyltransferase